MRNPKNRTERTIFRDSCIASYKQEMREIEELYPNVDDIFYSEHLGAWIVTYKNGLDDDEFETKADALEFLRTESQG